jgi:hypothetical protein
MRAHGQPTLGGPGWAPCDGPTVSLPCVALGSPRVIFKLPFLSSLVIPYITINLPQYFGDKEKLKGNASIKSKRKKEKRKKGENKPR